MFRTLLAGLIILCFSTIAARSEKFGHFEGVLSLTEVGDGDLDCKSSHWVGESAFRLAAPYAYVDASGRRWAVPKGACVNGASIPRPAQGVIGGPWAGKYKNASVVHDHYCVSAKEPWQAVHLMFYEAMRAKGVGKKTAALMYYIVYAFGPRWTTTVASRSTMRMVACPDQPSKRCRVIHSLKIRKSSPAIVPATAEGHAAMLKEIERARGLIESGSLTAATIPEYVSANPFPKLKRVFRSGPTEATNQFIRID